LPRPLPNEWGAAPCLDLVNSRWNDHVGSGEVHDRLPLPVWRRGFLRHWAYRVRDPDDEAAVRRLYRMRRVIRTALESHAATRKVPQAARAALEREVNRAPLKARVTAHGLVIERSGPDWDVVTSDIATSAVRLIGEGAVVKVCANPHCSWMFVDESRSGSRRWCDVSICGSLVNVRRYRRRHP